MWCKMVLRILGGGKRGTRESNGPGVKRAHGPSKGAVRKGPSSQRASTTLWVLLMKKRRTEEKQGGLNSEKKREVNSS